MMVKVGSPTCACPVSQTRYCAGGHSLEGGSKGQECLSSDPGSVIRRGVRTSCLIGITIGASDGWRARLTVWAVDFCPAVCERRCRGNAYRMVGHQRITMQAMARPFLEVIPGRPSDGGFERGNHCRRMMPAPGKVVKHVAFRRNLEAR
jgi:hypothetical protein